MALNFPGGKFFSGADSKTRIFLLLGSVLGIGIIIYLASLYLGGGGGTTGASKVAGAPQGLQSVPGGQVSPEYYRALAEANTQAAQKAQLTGSSAVPTILNVGDQSTGNCTVLCPSEDKPNVAEDINALVKAGKLSQSDANMLLDLAKRNASVDEYAAALDQLVREGKLTPEQARALLEKYKKQHDNALLAQSASAMDPLIKSGQLPLDVANHLLELQKRKLTPAEYAAELARLVREGKLSPQAAAALLAQYTQQYQQEKAKAAALALKQMARRGEITPDVANALTDMLSKKVPLDQYKTALDGLVADGKLTPAAAAKLLEQYRQLRQGPGESGLLGQMLQKGGPAADEAKRLLNMQANNATLDDYMNELKRAVAAGLITPEQAAQLLAEYQALLAAPSTAGISPTTEAAIPSTDQFAQLAKRVQGQAAPTSPLATPTAAEFTPAVSNASAEAEQARQQRVQALIASMSAQAQSLVAAWQPPTMEHKEGSSSTETKSTEETVTGQTTTTEKTGAEGTPAVVKRPLIKAGTIYFAILDTAVDSDYPDTPVLATIVNGPFKGAKLLGKLSLAQAQDRVSLNFTQMDRDDFPDTKSISAFAIDPDTARTVMASEVDHHYAERYGAIMAAAFVSGYSSSITQAGTSTTGIFGTSTEHGNISPGNKIAVGIGQIGTTLTSTLQSKINMPATVRITAGVGIGILFTTSVTE